MFQKMLKYILVTLIVLAGSSDANQMFGKNVLQGIGTDGGGLSEIKDLRTTPNKQIQEMVNLVEKDVMELLDARSINSTVNRFQAIKYRSQSVGGANFFVMVCHF